jgi:hypothetical protein
MVTTEKNLDRIDAQLRLWSVKVDALVARAEGAGALAAVNHRARIDELKARCAVAQARLDELRAAGRWQWRRYGSGIAQAWNDLVVAFRALERQTAT